MQFISPLTEDEIRRGRRLGGVLEDGEYIHSGAIFMRDAARSRTSQTAESAVTDAAIRREVDQAHARHDSKFAFMGDAAPKFDRDKAEFLARQRPIAEASRAVRDAVLASRYSGVPIPSAAPDAQTPTSNLADAGKAACDAIRAARYSG